jgi:hypothetical protein
MSDWVRFELGPPTLEGALGGAMFGAALAIVPALILGPAAFVIGLVLGAALGAVGLRPGTGVS